MSSRQKHLARILCSTLCCLMAVSCIGKGALESEKLAILTAGGQSVPLVAEIARTEAEQQKGYMGRKKIPDGTGMVFAYQADQKMFFWMKDTPHPLSIAFIDSSGQIREIRDMVPFSLETIESEHSVRFALEVPLGWFVRAGIAVGDRLAPESLAAITGPGKHSAPAK